MKTNRIRLMDASTIVGMTTAGIGACFILAAFLPQIYSTYQTKNTVGINKLMFVLHLIVGIFFFYGAVFIVASGLSQSDDSKVAMITNGSIFAVLNFVNSMGCLYTILLKNQNAREAQKMGISELEHYHQVCVPYVKEKMVNNKNFNGGATSEQLETSSRKENE